ncbi:cupin domain-containing protein [Sphingomonas baiyangensis]|uniref:Cupin domain-containing protein n=1 Tax=Sphingomonas baiyangensis TaxID=2572576 RepID=A0A4V6WRF9_9SPHN|nr:cupin domain-containing protein [Sphingomonas baiyangensis]TKD51328.1 cupin domain-containing protein [Sphingomonas baiyangensis]
MCDAVAPVIAGLKPHYCELAARRAILWCACGRSKRQPFCDGRSHAGTGIEPIGYRAGDAPEEVLLCLCKQTRTPPFCDGAHNNLPGGYRSDDRDSAALATLRRAERDAGGTRRLDGSCYVVDAAATRPSGERFWIRPIIAPSLGALHQSQFYVELREGASPVHNAGAGDAILFVAGGEGEIDIAGRRFAIGVEDGVHVRAGERFRLHAATPLSLYVSALPGIEALGEETAIEPVFDATFPRRVVPVDRAERAAMGPRWFQMLVDKAVGSTTAAQFIGHIPRSRAEMHRHLYEEALIILSGNGMLWNDESCAPVAAGDVIFLPRKHAHALECVDDAGMDVVGIIHPGDNPAINY